MRHEDAATDWFEQGDVADAQATIEVVRRARVIDPIEPSPWPCWSASAVLHGAFMALVLMIPPMAAWDMLDAEPHPALDRLISARMVIVTPTAVEPLRGVALLGDGHDVVLGARAAGDDGLAGAREPMREVERGQRREARARAQREQPTDLRSTLAALREVAREDESMDAALGQLRDAPSAQTRGVDGLGVSGAGRGGAGQDSSMGLAILPRRQARALGAQGVLAEGDSVGESELSVSYARALPTHGCLTPRMVEGAVQRREPQIRACYQAALERHPTLSGRLSLSLSIDQTGQISHISAEGDSLRDAVMERCIEERLATLRFPPFAQCERVVANFPFRFKRRALDPR
jgi:hypothetical protein